MIQSTYNEMSINEFSFVIWIIFKDAAWSKVVRDNFEEEFNRQKSEIKDIKVSNDGCWRMRAETENGIFFLQSYALSDLPKPQEDKRRYIIAQSGIPLDVLNRDVRPMCSTSDIYISIDGKYFVPESDYYSYM